jgi:hypothetical protein
MKQYFTLVLAILGLLALIPSESKAEVIVVAPGHSGGYYYHRHYYHHSYHHYYHEHYWHHD